jgi:molybdopterin molybdotransferase
LAAFGLTHVEVRRRLRVALFSTGDEIVAPGQPLRPGTQYDSNRYLLTALLRRRGALVSDLGILPDRPEAISGALAHAAGDHDLILTSGGVSTGEEDHVKQAVESLGALSFWRLAIKPGRPVAMGRIGEAAFVGLPGNPVASFITFVRFAGPLIDHLAGGAMRQAQGFFVVSDFNYAKKAGRREYVRASLAADGPGDLRARKFPREGAALLSSLIGTEGLVELPEECAGVSPGDDVSFIPYELLF